MISLGEYKKSRSKNFKKMLIRFAADYNEDVIEKMYAFGQAAGKEHYDKLKRRASDIEATDQLNSEEKSILIDSLIDQNHENDQAIELIAEMQVVALFKSIEIAIKNIMKHSDLFTESELRNTYKFNQLTELLKKRLALDISTLGGFVAFDELRVINNAIKHSGLVSAELAKYPHWKKGEKIKETHSHYQRIKNDVRTFIHNFRDKVLSGI